ncbi:hypothetical protein [Mycobacterium talmoniae]|uniref:Uncharacterized protein n=1 Tax=Mycobacterium talmoniae TaxID=1858794 RepID=A0A1S1NKC1_9MYCO|nr:hypothetical protein [Mycobacterium talmoniae]OHV02261.1 hypothetical protein BKN37_16070 [Mycobacterium talmoniae]
MPFYLLGSRTPSVEIPNQPVSITISGSVSGAALYVEASPGQNVVRVDAHTVIVPAFTETVTVGVEPVGAATFGHDNVVHLAIGPDSPGEVDPVQVGFDPVNVSGAGAIELALLRPRGPRVEVMVRAVADVPLSPLASMARTAARRATGNRRQSRGGALSIAVDTSASMRWAFGDGSVGAAVDVVVGVADVVGVQQVTATLVGARCTPVQAPVADLAQAVARAPVRWSAGARWSALPPNERTLLLTDSVKLLTQQPFPALRISADQRLRAAGPLLGPPPAGTPAERHLAANPALVDELAAALLPVLK